MGKGSRRILVVGPSSPILEGVADLLQLAGYLVDVSSNWAETESVMGIPPPSLVVVDLSHASSDVYHVAERIRSGPRWSTVPLLFVSFSGQDRIRELQQSIYSHGNGRIHFYTHNLLSVDGLLEKVRSCLA